MNILLLNHYAGSPRHGMEFRPYYLAREWVRMGHRVDIVACAQSHVRATAPQFPDPKAAQHSEVIDGIHYHWLQAPAYRGNGLGRLRNIAVFLARVWARRAQWLHPAQRPDVVIASSTYPLDIWVAEALARRAGCPWVYEVHDLWPQSLMELSGLSPYHPFVLWCGWAERAAYRRATRVVSMLPKVHEHMQARGLDLRRLCIVPNGVDPEAWAPGALQALPPSLQAVLSQARAAGAAVVGYAGSMGLPNALDTLVDALHHLKGQPVQVVLVGDGHERVRLQQRTHDEGLSAQVHWMPPIPKAQIPAFLHAVDVAYIGWQRVPLYRFGIAPNKLMDYLMAACTVLHAVEAGNDPVAEAGCGLTVPPDDPQAIAHGLMELLAWTPQQRQAAGARGRAFVVEHHAYPVLARRFLDCLT
jgi:glycosyltransferase involved in cell wall biosynthesis